MRETSHRPPPHPPPHSHSHQALTGSTYNTNSFSPPSDASPFHCPIPLSHRPLHSPPDPLRIPHSPGRQTTPSPSPSHPHLPSTFPSPFPIGLSNPLPTSSPSPHSLGRQATPSPSHPHLPSTFPSPFPIGLSNTLPTSSPSHTHRVDRQGHLLLQDEVVFSAILLGQWGVRGPASNSNVYRGKRS
jgi:hypothetical protein